MKSVTFTGPTKLGINNLANLVLPVEPPSIVRRVVAKLMPRAVTLTAATPRERLREAQSLLAERRAQLADAHAAVERVQSVIDQAGEADKAARVAHDDHRRAIYQWSVSGAIPEGRFRLDQLEAAAAEADKLADQAESTAEAARLALPALRAQVREVEISIDYAEQAVEDARAEIVLETIGPKLHALAQAAKVYHELRDDLEALHGVTNSASRYARDSSMFNKSAILTKALSPALTQAALDVRPVDNGDVEIRADLRDKRHAWWERLNAIVGDGS